MLQWFIRFPEFAEFTKYPFNLGKTPEEEMVDITIAIEIDYSSQHYNWKTSKCLK